MKLKKKKEKSPVKITGSNRNTKTSRSGHPCAPGARTKGFQGS